jgi:CO dehydrogenase/acetyl-CoA synthase alpha subunit
MMGCCAGSYRADEARQSATIAGTGTANTTNARHLRQFVDARLGNDVKVP